LLAEKSASPKSKHWQVWINDFRLSS